MPGVGVGTETPAWLTLLRVENSVRQYEKTGWPWERAGHLPLLVGTGCWSLGELLSHLQERMFVALLWTPL